MRSVNTSAFFMFLQKVYRHSKILFAAMVFFIAMQLFINYKHGVVLSPFYHYGMYSGVMNTNDSYTIFAVGLNGKQLRGQDFSSQQWDQIMLPLQYYSAINKSNELYEADIKRLLEKMHL